MRNHIPRHALACSVALAATLALGVPSLASAEDYSQNHIHGVRADVHGNLGGYGSVGAGFRIDIPLVPNGFLDNVDDEFALSLGLDAFFYDFFPGYYDGGLYLIPIAVVQWNFYIHPKWSVFPEAGLAFYVGPGNSELRNGRRFYPTPAFSVGARYHFNTRNALLLRVSTPAGISVGITF